MPVLPVRSYSKRHVEHQLHSRQNGTSGDGGGGGGGGFSESAVTIGVSIPSSMAGIILTMSDRRNHSPRHHSLRITILVPSKMEASGQESTLHPHEVLEKEVADMATWREVLGRAQPRSIVYQHRQHRQQHQWPWVGNGR
jgi:hypothetical protein